MASLTKFYIDNGIKHLGGKEAIETDGWSMNTIGLDGLVTITSPTGIYISGQHWSTFCDVNGSAYTSLVAFRDAANGFFGTGAYPSGRPIKLTASFNRPANTSDYAANDHVSSVVANVKQKETITVSGSVKAKQKETMTLTGTVAVKQKETITITGTSGTFIISGTGGISKTVTFSEDTTLTATAFCSAENIAAYLYKGIVLTHSTNTIVFEAKVAGAPFTAPTVTAGITNLAGSVAHTVANHTVALGHGYVTLAGGLSLPITFDTTPTVTAANFASDLNKAAYLAKHIVLTNSGATLVFESEGDDQPFTAPLLVTKQGDLAGSVAHTRAYVPIGRALVSGLGGLSKEMVFTTDAATACTNFVASHIAAYLAAGIALTNSTNTVIFEASTAGVPMGTPAFMATAGDLAGAIVHTTANATIAPFSFTGNAALSNGGGGMITLTKIEAPAKFAGQVLTVYIYNDTPTGLVGDNVPFVLDTANVSKRVGRIQITMDAVINSSTVVFGQDASYLPYQCASSLRTLKGVLVVGGAVVAPETGGLFTLSLTVTIQA